MESSTAIKVEQPIIFTLRGIKPDTRLVVFSKTFHVHSQKLKECSAFFFKFMDSPDKATAATKGLFKYEWVTKIDEDGCWVLGSVVDTQVSEST